MTAERAHPNDPGFNKDSPYYKKFVERYMFANKFIDNTDMVLDVPCGVGWGTSMLRGKLVYGMDIDKKSINEARSMWEAQENRLIFYSGDMTKSLGVQFNSIDKVVCLDGIEHVTKEGALYFLKLVHTVLHPEKLLLLTTVVEDNSPIRNPYHEYEYSVQELLDKLGKLKFAIRDYAIKDGVDKQDIYIVAQQIPE